MFECWTSRIMIQQDFQFVGTSRVIQQSGCEVLTLFSQFEILILELMLEEA